MPENAIFVGKGSVYESPFRVVQLPSGRWAVKTSVEPKGLTDILIACCHVDYKTKADAAVDANTCYKVYLQNNPKLLALIYKTLPGKNLASFTKLDETCHVDVLIELLKDDKQ